MGNIDDIFSWTMMENISKNRKSGVAVEANIIFGRGTGTVASPPTVWFLGRRFCLHLGRTGRHLAEIGDASAAAVIYNNNSAPARKTTRQKIGREKCIRTERPSKLSSRRPGEPKIPNTGDAIGTPPGRGPAARRVRNIADKIVVANWPDNDRYDR